jgi:hypothetical protein
MQTVVARTKVALAVAMCLLVAGCAPSGGMNKATYDKIQNGMSPEEVGKLFGFEKVKEPGGALGILKGEAVSTVNGIDRTTKMTEDGYIYDTFFSQEMGGVNKKEIQVRYLNGQVEWKDQSGVE